MQAVEPECLGLNPASVAYLLASLCHTLVNCEIKCHIVDVSSFYHRYPLDVSLTGSYGNMNK